MPKRVGSEPLGPHECLLPYQIQALPTIQDHPILLSLYLVMTTLPTVFPTTSDIFVYLIGILCLPLLLYGFYTPARHVAMTFYNKLDPATPWNINKLVVLYYPRHYRKHGRIKLIPRYPTISLRQLPIFMMLLLSESTQSLSLSNRTRTRLQHTPWGSPCPEPLPLRYYDINFDQLWNPANIMASSRQRPTSTDDWGSLTLPTPTFPPDYVDTGDLFPDDHDPSSIVKILQFGLKSKQLTRSDAPLCVT